VGLRGPKEPFVRWTHRPFWKGATEVGLRGPKEPFVRWTHRPTLGRNDQDRAQRAGYLRLASGLMYGKALLAGTGELQRPLVLPGLQWVERATPVLPLAEEDGAVRACGSA